MQQTIDFNYTVIDGVDRFGFNMLPCQLSHDGIIDLENYFVEADGKVNLHGRKLALQEQDVPNGLMVLKRSEGKNEVLHKEKNIKIWLYDEKSLTQVKQELIHIQGALKVIHDEND